MSAASLDLLACAFWLGAIRGGDAPLLAAATVRVGPGIAVIFARLLAAAASLYTIGARLGWRPHRGLGARLATPLGRSITVAWLATMDLTVSSRM